MIRHFCDVCDTEIKRNYVSERLGSDDALRGKPYPQGGLDGLGIRLQAGKPRVQIEIHLAVGPTWNKGDLCLDCLLTAIDACDPRPRAA